MKGACLCGRVQVEIDHAPPYINICNCRFCRSLGAAWGYFGVEEVTVTGETRGYSRDDLDDVWLAGHFCPTCGTVTHYTVIKEGEGDGLAINTRIFPQDELDGIEVRYLDGRSVESEEDDFVRTGLGHIGDGKAF